MRILKENENIETALKSNVNYRFYPYGKAEKWY